MKKKILENISRVTLIISGLIVFLSFIIPSGEGISARAIVSMIYFGYIAWYSYSVLNFLEKPISKNK